MPSLWDWTLSWAAYEMQVRRLVWRGGLSRDFARVMAIPGQMRRSEVRCLYDLASQADRAGVIVEIGSNRGLSTAGLARGSLRGPGIPVFAIDPHEFDDSGGGSGRTPWRYGADDREAFFLNIMLAGVSRIVRPVSLLSWDAASGWDRPVSLLWIDGDHSYEAARRDFDLWARFVVPGGWAGLHDSTDPAEGPHRVVSQALATGEWEATARFERTTVLRRRGPGAAEAAGPVAAIGA